MTAASPHLSAGTVDAPMKVWFDTEFIEDGTTIDLISIGMVREDGATYYAETDQWIPGKASQWVKDNVLVHLKGGDSIKPRDVIAREIVEFAGWKPEFWAYYADYDWVALCQLYGTMMHLPDGWPMFCRDVKQLCVTLGDPELPKQTSTEHHALTDAVWTKTAWQFLQSYPYRVPAQSVPDSGESVAISDRLTNIMTWLREPDWTEQATLEWIKDWVNRRPIAELAMVAMLMPSPAPSSWQPIETAPRDGTQFLAALSNGWVTIISEIRGYDRYAWYRTNGISIPVARTHAPESLSDSILALHWMPLPAAPKSAEPASQLASTQGKSPAKQQGNWVRVTEPCRHQNCEFPACDCEWDPIPSVSNPSTKPCTFPECECGDGIHACPEADRSVKSGGASS